MIDMRRLPVVAGVIAQLGERYNGIVEVGGSIPPGSTILFVVLEVDSFIHFFITSTSCWCVFFI